MQNSIFRGIRYLLRVFQETQSRDYEIARHFAQYTLARCHRSAFPFEVRVYIQMVSGFRNGKSICWAWNTGNVLELHYRLWENYAKPEFSHLTAGGEILNIDSKLKERGQKACVTRL